MRNSAEGLTGEGAVGTPTPRLPTDPVERNSTRAGLEERGCCVQAKPRSLLQPPWAQPGSRAAAAPSLSCWRGRTTSHLCTPSAASACCWTPQLCTAEHCGLCSTPQPLTSVGLLGYCVQSLTWKGRALGGTIPGLMIQHISYTVLETGKEILKRSAEVRKLFLCLFYLSCIAQYLMSEDVWIFWLNMRYRVGFFILSCSCLL